MWLSKAKYHFYWGVFLITTSASLGSIMDNKCGPNGSQIITTDPWVHAGEGATVFLKCNICQTLHVWWTRDGQILPHNSHKFTYHHRPHGEYLLRIRGIRRQDFGQYSCQAFSNETKTHQKASVFVTGVPYPAKFDRPVNHSQTTFSLSWRVNSSFNAPIINYHLEFKELPHGQWISVNIPANSCDRQVNSPFQMVEFNQSYTLKGLEKGANYQARIISRNKFGFSLDTEIDLIQSIFVKDAPMLNSEPLSTTLSSLSCRTDVMQLCAIIIWCGAALVVLN